MRRAAHPAPRAGAGVAAIAAIVCATLAAPAAPAATLGGQLPQATPRVGLVVTHSTAFRPGTYHLTAPSPAIPPPSGDSALADSAVIVVRGDNVTLDLAGVYLVGASPDSAPDRASGVAILVDGGANVTIRNAHVRGYKVAILARGTRNLHLIDNDLSYNWKPRLFSIVEHESLVDWLSYHHNDKDEWLRYGAAMYLSGVRSGEVRGNTVNQGMNALLLTGTDSILVAGNDFSFNSGLGIGLYRSSHNRVLHNRVDYDVRGYSEGFYRRGQDSAGILLYEQSDSNTVAFNSVTHGGDGLFLWAGQTTMDSGEGGANDNLFVENDFSWAPTNAMEATFSRNTFVRNRAVGSDYGLWGGYSFNSVVADNTFERNRIGVAIEHGQDNAIVGNRFERNGTDVYLWGNKIEPGDWGYPKHRDTRSRDYRVEYNVMSGARVAFRIGDTHGATVRNNAVSADTLLVVRGDTAALEVDSMPRGAGVPFEVYAANVQPLAGVPKVLPSAYAVWPRSSIVVDEWGPYDWKSPKLWPMDSSLATPLKLRVLTPLGVGRWRVLRASGAEVRPTSGNDGDTIVVTPAAGAVEDWTVTLEYRGRPTVSPTGVRRGTNVPYAFRYSRFDPKLSWDVRVFAWSDSTHPLNAPEGFAALVRGERDTAVVSLTTPRLDYMWYRPTVAGWPQERAAVVATTSVELPAGDYAIRAISDDGVRVFVDDSLVIENWSVHESEVREAPLAAGTHRLRVEYFQGDGWSELRVEIVKR